MFQIGDWRLRIANLWKASCKLAAYEFTDNKTAGTSATSYFSCFGDPGCFNQTPEIVPGESCFQTTLACRHGRRCKLRRGSGCGEPRGLYPQVAYCSKGTQ